MRIMFPRRRRPRPNGVILASQRPGPVAFPRDLLATMMVRPYVTSVRLCFGEWQVKVRRPPAPKPDTRIPRAADLGQAPRAALADWLDPAGGHSSKVGTWRVYDVTALHDEDGDVWDIALRSMTARDESAIRVPHVLDIPEDCRDALTAWLSITRAPAPAVPQ